VASSADRVKIELQPVKAGILDCFEGCVFSGHEMPRSKPFPDVYLAAAAGLGVESTRCAVIEDSVTGARASAAAGATVFGYCPAHLSHSSATALHGAGAVHVFRDMAELPALLAGWVRR
jgi:beta-phosphoglucomutase-like phosphatase (HAD superfamily)